MIYPRTFNPGSGCFVYLGLKLFAIGGANNENFGGEVINLFAGQPAYVEEKLIW